MKTTDQIVNWEIPRREETIDIDILVDFIDDQLLLDNLERFLLKRDFNESQIDLFFRDIGLKEN